MADIMTLDLTGAGGDDGLLVPFSRPTAPAVTPERNETESLFNSNSNHSNNNNNRRNENNRQGSAHRGFGGFFRRNNFDKEAAEEERRNNLPLKTTTFAFPKAHVEQADIPEPPPPKKEKQPQDESEGSSSGEDDSNDEYETDDEPPKPPPSLKKMDDWDPTQNPYYEEREGSRPWRVEGFGTKPIATQDKKPKGLGGFFSRFGRNNRDDDDLRSMRVATEDTKDQKSMAEQVAKAALVVLVPELYADDDDGDGNLGLYRSLSTATDEEAVKRRQAQSRNVAMTNEVGGMRMSSALGGGLRLVGNSSIGDDPSIVVRNEVKQLRLKVAKVDKALKSARLEADAWKLRCKELETELRRYNGKSDDNSSIEAEGYSDDEEESDEEDDGIEEEWTGYDSVKVENLLEIPGKEQKPAPDPLMENEGNLLDMKDPEEPSLLDFTEITAAARSADPPSMIDISVESVEKPTVATEEPSLLRVQEITTTPEVESAPDLIELPEEPKHIVFDSLKEEASTDSIDLHEATTTRLEAETSPDLLELPEEAKSVVFDPLEE